jgi:asparagine synthase (glutamine-hydrolysing)
MCGIFGAMWHLEDEVPDSQALARTAARLRHRGPDGAGTYAAPGVALVHSRLALLDPDERSNQPFWDRTRRFALVYNGEIYNFAALRGELGQRGIGFRTTSDTEVLLEALIAWGADATLPKLEGMFAFALYDSREQTLLLARDRFGIKPLFVYETPERCAFASEIAAFESWIPRRPDVLSISAFLHGFPGPHRGHTFLERVRCADPGSTIRIRRGERSRATRFFALAQLVDPDERARLAGLSDRAMVDLVDETLNDTVKSQLVADAPVGALCSGGVDSSLIVAIAARHHTNLAIFHADVTGPLSERDAASALAKHLKLDLKTAVVRDEDFIDRIPQVVEHYGHPFYPNPHAVPFLMVSETVHANRVKAVLTGEGADECYLGYHWLAPDIRQWRRLLRRMIARALGRRSGTDDARAERYWGPVWEGAEVVPRGRWSNQSSLVTALHNRFEVVGEARALREELAGRGPIPVGAVQSLDLLHYNLRTLLHRNDSMGMAASLESRFPFLDSTFVRHAINMPPSAKIRFSPRSRDRAHYFFENKWALRRVADRYLPRALSHRRKIGFPVNAHDRMAIDPAFWQGSCLADLFEVTGRDLDEVVAQAPQTLRVRLLQTEAWASLFLRGDCCDGLRQRLHRTVRVLPLAHAV